MSLNSSYDDGWQAATLPGAATRSLSGGYRLWTASAGKDEGPLPILWVLDGAALFTSVARAVALLARRGDATGVGSMLVVGVDHDPPDRARRDEDYSFGPACDPAAFAHPARSGGGEAMLDRLAGPMFSAVMARHQADASRQMLLGHSLAGLFALHAIAARAASFRVVAAISPSIWWDREAICGAVASMADRSQSLFLGAGGREEPERIESEADRRRDARGIVRETQNMAAIAAARLGEQRVALRIAADEDHASAPLALLPAFLRFASRAV